MAGLLDNIDGDTILSGLLSAGAASGAKGPYLARVAAGLAQGERFRQARSQEVMQKEYRDLQVKKLNMEMKQAEAAAAKKVELSDMTKRLFGGTSEGAFTTPVDGRGPVMPSSMAGGGGFANAKIDQIALLKALGGPDMIDAHKYANDPLKLEQGATYQNRTTGQRETMPRFGDGIIPDGKGGFMVAPGYAASNAAIKGAETTAVEAARAGSELVDVPQSDGTTAKMPKSQALKLLGGQQQEQQPQAVQNLGGNLSPELLKFIQADAAKNGITNPVARIGQPGQNMALSQEGAQPTTAPRLGVTQSPSDAARVKFNTERDLQKPVLLATAKNQIAVLDKALNHPGLSAATGLQGLIDPRNYIPGTNATDFQKVLDQIGGATFLQAFESLKGGGQITQVEGQKATDAIARLSRAQSTPEFKTALQDLRKVMQGGYDRLNGTEPTQDAKPTRTVEKTGMYGGKKVVQYSDGSVEYAN